MRAWGKFVPRAVLLPVAALLVAFATRAGGYQKVDIPPAFEKVFRAVFEGSRTQERFTATGTLSVHVVSGDVVKDLHCTVSLAKRKPNAFAVSVARAEDGRLLARAVSKGAKGQASLFLPRELVMSATPNRIGQVTDTYTLPLVIMLFDLLDDGKLDRWPSRLGAAEYVGPNADKHAPTEHLYFNLNRYWTLRDVNVDLWVGQGRSPFLTRMDVDLTTALTQRGPASWVKPGGSVNLSLLLPDWSADKEPDAALFDPPSSPKLYGELNLHEVMLADSPAS
jgi:hypothetical protein